MPHKILTIGGSDSLSGGGIQADLSTFSEYGFFGLSVITSIVTVTPTEFNIFPVDEHILITQLDSIATVDDLVAIKIGLLPNVSTVKLVANFIRLYPNIPIIVDPVMVFKENNAVNTKHMVEAICEYLLPLATIVTPNIAETEVIVGKTINTRENMIDAAKKIYQYGAKNIIIKGGKRLPGKKAVDILFNGKTVTVFKEDKILTSIPLNNGAGCTFSASLATCYIKSSGKIVESTKQAKKFVWQGIKHGVTIGKGYNVGNVWQGSSRRIDCE